MTVNLIADTSDEALYVAVQESMDILRAEPDADDTTTFARVAYKDNAVGANITLLGFMRALTEAAPDQAVVFSILRRAGVFAEEFAQRYERHEATLTAV